MSRDRYIRKNVWNCERLGPCATCKAPAGTPCYSVAGGKINSWSAEQAPDARLRDHSPAPYDGCGSYSLPFLGTIGGAR